MESARFERLIGFISRHQLLSSLLCLLTLFLILMTFLMYGHSVEHQDWLNGFLQVIRHKPLLAIGAFAPMLLLPLPVVILSILLWQFMGTSDRGNPPLSLFDRFIWAGVPSFFINFVITGWMSIRQDHRGNLITFILAPVVSMIGGIVFGVVLGSQTKATRGMIVIHSVIISSLMGVWFFGLFVFFGMRL